MLDTIINYIHNRLVEKTTTFLRVKYYLYKNGKDFVENSPNVYRVLNTNTNLLYFKQWIENK